jgi:tRNA U38,U39,U40 pseudouridine synthase TruA
MVRRIVGVLAAVGRGELRPEDAGAFLDPAVPAAKGVQPAALSAPAAGLFLEHVRYPGDPGPGPINPTIAIDA